MVKTLFIKLKERALLRDKTVIPRDLSAREGDLIDLVTNKDGNNNLRKDAVPEVFISNLIIFNFNFNPESSEINHYGFNLEVKLWELNFVRHIVNLILKALNE